MTPAPPRRWATRISRCACSARCAMSSSAASGCCPAYARRSSSCKRSATMSPVRATRASFSSAPPPHSASSCCSRSPTTSSAQTSSVPPSPSACRPSVPRSLLKPALFFDFDNTLTRGDVLDELIERYSPNEAWRDWEEAWQQGRLAARECLQLQVENMRVSRERLLDDVARVRIDPVFAEIVDWARHRGVAVRIVSDSFLPLITHILAANGITGVPVFANHLDFAPGKRLLPWFPHYDPASACSANAKARHLAPYRALHQLVF